MRSAQFRRSAVFVVAAACLLAAAGCARLTPYTRTLPEWVERVYVPMADNRTYEPGLEELVTNGFTAEALADGRLEPVQRGKADAVVRLTVHEYGESSADFENDDVEHRKGINMVLSAALYAPDDPDRPFASTGSFPVEMEYVSDIRSTYAETGVEARERLAEMAGRTALHKILNESAPVE